MKCYSCGDSASKCLATQQSSKVVVEWTYLCAKCYLQLKV